jgi:hypothetical protein
MNKQPNIGDKIKYYGYTEEAYKNGSVPTFVAETGIVLEVEGKLHIKFANGWILPLYYLDNIELVQTRQSIFEHKMETDYTPTKCIGCDLWDDMSGTPPHCQIDKCIKTKEESFFGNQQFSNEDTRMNTCKHYSDFNQCQMGHYDEDRHVFCAVCISCDDYCPKLKKVLFQPEEIFPQEKPTRRT